MTTAHQAIATAIGDALRAAPALAGGRVYANRVRTLPAGADSFVIVRLDRSMSQAAVLGVYDWTTSLAVECYARSVGDDPAVAVDQLLQDAWARLAPLQIPDVGQMALVLEPLIEWQVDEADGGYVCAAFRLSIVHRTPTASLTA